MVFKKVTFTAPANTSLPVYINIRPVLTLDGVANFVLRKTSKSITSVKRLFFALLLIVQPYAHAANTDSPYFKGGKIDSNYERYDNGDFAVNNFLWTPVFKGGAGSVISQTGGQDINYFGGYARPLLTRPELGELFLGAQEVLQGDRKSTEVQGEYRLPNGLGVGGGFVDRSQSNQDVKFAKVSYQNNWKDIKYIASTQWQRFAGKDYGGGYVAVYNKELMATYGNDGEQWRSSFGYIGPQITEKLRPAIEALYIDNSIGKIGSDRTAMISGSLGYSKGFLSHEARLGRAMGPTGMQFSNPQAFLTTATDPSFNRRLQAWELGGLANFRYINTSVSAGSPRTETFEFNVFPGQVLGVDNLLSAVFVGAGITHPNGGLPYKSTSGPANKDGVSGIIGYVKRFGQVESNVRVQHDFDVNDTQLYAGAQYWL